MMNIKLFNKISNTGLDLFDANKYTCAEEIQAPDAILVRSAKMHDVDLDANTKCIARAGAGVNNIPIEECAKKGVVVFNTPGANANAVKELVISALLMSSRKITDGISWCKTLKGSDDAEALVEKGKAQFVGPEISGKKLGVIGLGAIGVMVANSAKSLGMQVYGYDPYISIKAAWGLSAGIHHATNIREIFENCDYITLHVPLTDETKYTINKESISLMKSDVRILNFSRGDLVCDDDIIEALENGKLSAYVTDFPNAKLLECDKVIPIPHLGASTPESEDNCAKMAVLQTVEYLENGNIVNSVNYPNIELPREAKTRLCVANENIPNIVGTISTILASENINIENMANKSRGNFAYTIIETNSEIAAGVCEKIKEQKGVISVRVIQ